MELLTNETGYRYCLIGRKQELLVGIRLGPIQVSIGLWKATYSKRRELAKQGFTTPPTSWNSKLRDYPKI